MSSLKIISNASFDLALGWKHNKESLPINPVTKIPIILVPKDFLSTSFHLDREDFLLYSLSIENSTIRTQASRLFTSEISKKGLLEIVKQNKELMKYLLKGYIEKKEKEKAIPYDVDNDPMIINEIPRKIEEIIEGLKEIKVDSFTFDDLKNFVEKIIKEFRFQVENNLGKAILFDDKGNPLKERISQVYFGSIGSAICRNTGGLVDINSEAETGRGPVDFKFSRGYGKRIIVELKLAGNKERLLRGLEKQIPIYLSSSEIDVAYYVVIKQISGDGVRIAELNDRHSKINLQKGKEIHIEIIDATYKLSASKVK